MADFDPTTIREVRITNDAPGPRYVNTVGGQLIVQPGTTSGAVEMREGELQALPQGLRESTAAPAATGGDLGTGEGDRDTAPVLFQWPEDLASATSNDGLISRKDLLEIAKAETVETESDDNKPTIAGKIVAQRRKAEAAAAGQ